MTAKFKLGALAAGVIAMGLASPAFAAGYPDKDITLVVPFSPGGGFDTYARLIAPFLEKHLPNKVHVIVKNEPGAGGRKGLTDVYRSKPDGYKLVIVNVPGAMVPPIIGQQGAVRPGEDHLDRAAQLSTPICCAVPASRRSRLSPTSRLLPPRTRSSSPRPAPARPRTPWTKVFFGVLGIKGQIVTGYKGTKEMTLAVMRGDTPAGILPQQSTRKYIQAGDIRALLTTDGPEPL